MKSRLLGRTGGEIANSNSHLWWIFFDGDDLVYNWLMLSWWCWSWRFKLNYSPEMGKEINREEFLASSKIAQFWNNHWRRKADVTGRCIRIWNLLLILMQICLKLHFRYHSLSDVDGDEDWLFAKTTYSRVVCKRSHHHTVVGSPDYLYYLHAPYLKLLISNTALYTCWSLTL